MDNSMHLAFNVSPCFIEYGFEDVSTIRSDYSSTGSNECRSRHNQTYTHRSHLVNCNSDNDGMCGGSDSDDLNSTRNI